MFARQKKITWPGAADALPGVYTTAVGYAGGYTPNPTCGIGGTGVSCPTGTGVAGRQTAG